MTNGLKIWITLGFVLVFMLMVGLATNNDMIVFVSFWTLLVGAIITAVVWVWRS